MLSVLSVGAKLDRHTRKKHLMLTTPAASIKCLIASTDLAIIVQTLWNGGTISGNIRNIDFIAVALIMLCIFFLRKIKMNPIFVMLGAGVVGGLVYGLI
jgi:chromate transporter